MMSPLEVELMETFRKLDPDGQDGLVRVAKGRLRIMEETDEQFDDDDV